MEKILTLLDKTTCQSRKALKCWKKHVIREKDYITGQNVMLVEKNILMMVKPTCQSRKTLHE